MNTIDRALVATFAIAAFFSVAYCLSLKEMNKDLRREIQANRQKIEVLSRQPKRAVYVAENQLQKKGTIR